MGRLSASQMSGMTEADFNAAFGCSGMLIRGSRSPGTPYTMEWCDDDCVERVSFGADGRSAGIEGGPVVDYGSMHILTPGERLKLALWRMGIDVR
jgi:hypothetical protein